jgi:hypothetical protein
MRKGPVNGAPSVLETIRLNLTVFERASAAGDVGTAKRSVDAAEVMFKGLRDLASGQGCDVGPSAWSQPQGIVEDLAEGARRAEEATVKVRQPVPMPPDTPRPAPVLAFPPPAPEETRLASAELEATLRRVLAEQRREVLPPVPEGWIARLERREWSWGMLARLTWTLVCCAAGMFWRVLRGKKKGGHHDK